MALPAQPANAPTTATAPGFENWKTSTKPVNEGKLSEMSRYDRVASKFSQTVKIEHTDAFTLKPLILTDGPLSGRHILVLEPIATFFRFMDLPPEIRQMVYDLLVSERDRNINVWTHKPPHQQRRIRKTPTVGSISNPFRTNKELHREAATTFYAYQTSDFDKLTDMAFFFETIGSVAKHIRFVRLRANGYVPTRARHAFTFLKNCTNLQSLEFHHSTVCRLGPGQLVEDCRPMLQKLHKSVGQQLDVPSIIRIWGSEETKRCPKCGTEPLRKNCIGRICGDWSSDSMEDHCEKLAGEVRKLVEVAIGVKT